MNLQKTNSGSSPVLSRLTRLEWLTYKTQSGWSVVVNAVIGWWLQKEWVILLPGCVHNYRSTQSWEVGLTELHSRDRSFGYLRNNITLSDLIVGLIGRPSMLSKRVMLRVVRDEVRTSAGHYPVRSNQTFCRVCQKNTKRGCGKCGLNLQDACLMVFRSN